MQKLQQSLILRALQPGDQPAQERGTAASHRGKRRREAGGIGGRREQVAVRAAWLGRFSQKAPKILDAEPLPAQDAQGPREAERRCTAS